MNASAHIHRFSIEPIDPRRFASLCGQFDENLRLIEQRLGIEVRNRGNHFELIGDDSLTRAAEAVLRQLYRETRDNDALSPDTVHLYLQESGLESLSHLLARGAAADGKDGGGELRLRWPTSDEQDRVVRINCANAVTEDWVHRCAAGKASVVLVGPLVVHAPERFASNVIHVGGRLASVEEA